MNLDSIIKESRNGTHLLQDLTVLTNDPYRFNTPTHRRNAEWFAEQIDRFLQPYAKIHNRGVHYVISTAGDVVMPPKLTNSGRKAVKVKIRPPYYINDHECYLFLKRASTAARWLGLVPFERIVDKRNAPPEIFVPEHFTPDFGLDRGLDVNIPDVTSLIPRFICNLSPRQLYRIAFVGEKSSLNPILRPIAEKIGAELILPTGQLSSTLIHGVAERAYKDGRPLVILYFSDFDPAGFGMAVVISRQLQAFRDFQYPSLKAQVHPVALTVDQVREFNLPSAPLKETVHGRDRWIETFHHEQTEIDALCALKPELLEEITEEAIRPFYDEDLEDKRQDRESEWEEDAAEVLEAHPGYAEQLSIITEAHRELKDAAARLYEARARAEEVLENVEPPNLFEPEAEIYEEAPDPIFTTEDDFVTASLKLKAYRELVGADEGNGEED
jgi:hypothetical protein